MTEMSKYQCWQELSLTEGESTETEIKILDVGRKVQRGGAGEFEITPAMLAEMVANHEREAPGYEPPAVVGHPKLRDQAEAVGWVKGLRAAADGLYARVSFLSDFAAKIKAGSYRYSSPSFTFDWQDETGEKRGAKLLDLGILNNPFQKSLGAFALSEVPNSVVGNDPKDHDMADANVELGELRLTTKQQGEQIATLSETITTLEADAVTATASLGEMTTLRDTLKTANAELNAKVNAVQAEKDSAEVASVLKTALGEGKLSPAQVPKHGTDEFNGMTWLSESPFHDLDSLNLFLKTAPPVVDLGDRKSVPSSNDGSDAETRERLKGEALAAQAANPNLSDKQAMDLAISLSD